MAGFVVGHAYRLWAIAPCELLHWETARRFTMPFPIGDSVREDMMRLHYYPETDTLHIALSDKPGVDAEEIAEDVVVDYDENRRVLSIEIEHASTWIDLTKLETRALPIAG